MDAIELHSGEYVKRFAESPIERVRRLVNAMELTAESKVVDYGCGLGMLLQCLPRYGSYTGVDFSADFIEMARTLAKDAPNADFHCTDIVSFCEQNPSEFDVAATLDFSEHIDDETFLKLYSAIGRSLAPDGKLYLHTPNLNFAIERLKDVGILKQFPEHIAVRSAKQLVKLLSQCGFSYVSVARIAHYNVLKHLHPLSHLPGVGDFFAARLWIEAKVTR